jgi:magnesium-transporting ATPase (P-type)
LYYLGHGDLGNECNDRWSPACDEVFRARATAFSCLTWFSVFLAWELVDLRQSIFSLGRGNGKRWIQVLWQNKVLFTAVIVGLVTLFPVLYIPVINRNVFKHSGITREWGLVVLATVLFFLGVEAWKFCKRLYFRKKESRDVEARGSEEDQVLRKLGYHH